MKKECLKIIATFLIINIQKKLEILFHKEYDEGYVLHFIIQFLDKVFV